MIPCRREGGSTLPRAGTDTSWWVGLDRQQLLAAVAVHAFRPMTFGWELGRRELADRMVSLSALGNAVLRHRREVGFDTPSVRLL